MQSAGRAKVPINLLGNTITFVTNVTIKTIIIFFTKMF